MHYSRLARVVLVSLCVAASGSVAALAQEAEPLPAEPQQLEAVITSLDSIAVNKKIIFDASASRVESSSDDEPFYRWDFGDGSPPATGVEVVHEYSQTGAQTIRLTLRQGERTSSVEKMIFVFDRQAVLITDEATRVGIEQIDREAASHGVLLTIITSGDEATGFLTEEALLKLVGAQVSNLIAADMLLFYTRSGLGVQAFARYTQTITEAQREAVAQKLLVKVTDENIELAENTTLQAFRVIKPAFILLTRPEALSPLFEVRSTTDAIDMLSSRAIEYRIIDDRTERSPAFLLSWLTSNFVARGVPPNVIYLLLAFPFVALCIAFFRQVIGLTLFGVYAPTVLTMSFMILGIKFGLAALAVVLLVSYVLRVALARFELLYVPRVALLLSLTILSFFGIIWVMLLLGTSVTIALAIFPMIVMTTLAEKFLSAQAEEGMRNAVIGVVATIGVTILAYYVVTWGTFSNWLSSFPELVIVALLGLLVLGRFTGLRLTEYFRFRMLLSEQSSEE